VTKRKRDELEKSKNAQNNDAENEIKERLRVREKKNTIKLWHGAFKDILDPVVKGKDLEKMAESTLDALSHECKWAVAAKNSSMVSDQTMLSLISFFGDLGHEHFGINTEGPRISLKQLASSKDCSDLMKEVSLEYAQWVYQRPEMRLLFFLANGLYAVHSINTEALAKGETIPQSEPNKEPDPKRQKTSDQDGPSGPPKKDKDGYEILS
jgi:hypothetical protein